MRVVKEISSFANKIKSDNLSAFASEATLFIMLSFVPFLMLLLTLVKYTPLNEGMLIGFVESFAPDAINTALQSVIDQLYTQKGSGIIVITILSTLWAAGKGFVSLIDGLNSVFDINEKRNWFVIRLYAILYTIVFIVVIVICIVIFVLAGLLLNILYKYAPFPAAIIDTFIQHRAPVSITLFTFLFTLLYVAIPNRHTKINRQLPGAVFSALGWTVVSYIFSIYVNYSDRLSILYGSLTSLVVLILWLYVSMYIFLIGAEINMYIEQCLINREIKKASPTNLNTHS